MFHNGLNKPAKNQKYNIFKKLTEIETFIVEKVFIIFIEHMHVKK